MPESRRDALDNAVPAFQLLKAWTLSIAGGGFVVSIVSSGSGDMGGKLRKAPASNYLS